MPARFLTVVACLLAAVPAMAASYAWDFHNGHFDNLSLVPMGPGAVNLLVPTNEGLRITIPAGNDLKAVGFSPRFTLRGDFEVTVEFTILSRTKPKGGFGTGPSIYLSTGTTQDPAASLGRLLRPDGRDIYGVFAARVDNGERTPAAKLFDVPASRVLTGRLQLKRTKNEISYSVADNRDSPLRPLAVLPMSDREITMMRIGVSQSDPQSAGIVLLHTIRIDSAEMPHIPSEQSRTAQLYRPRYQPPPAPVSYRWLWQSLVALLLACGSAAWCWKRNH